MPRKIINAIISIFLILTTCILTCTNAFAASSRDKTYVKEVYLSYGNTEDEAKNWLTNNGYEVLDYNLNEGADDIFSTKRAVYLGYKTTTDPEEAITDMRLMNMKGGYSVQDYQMLLDEQKSNIQAFISDFVISVNEYRNNYNNGQERAKAAHDMLNLLYDDDTQQYMGDLLLNRVKEEYSDEEYNALSDEEKSKIADMTTILMQGSSGAVLSIEQIIALACDDTNTLWMDRYSSAKTYDEMVEALMDEKNLSVDQAVKELAAEYDEDAKAIYSKFEDYKNYLNNYLKEDLSLDSSQKEIDAYAAEHEDFDVTNWLAAGTQYVLLNTLVNDDISLYDLITNNEYDLNNTDRYLLYPLVSVLTKGQRACLDFLPMYQIVSLGINGDEAYKDAMEQTDIASKEKLKVSVYDGVDRTIFGNEVALTNEALRFQASSGNDAVSGVFGSISLTSIVLYSVFAVSFAATVASWVLSSHMKSVAEQFLLDYDTAKGNISYFGKKTTQAIDDEAYNYYNQKYSDSVDAVDEALAGVGRSQTWEKVFYYSGIAMTCISIILFGVAIWSTYNDMKAYYNAEFTPIPMHMVNQDVNENDEKTFTYYTAVKCNRQEQNMVTDSTKLLGDFGDLNGDVGRQWVALYTTKDKAAGNPITTKLLVRYENSNLPDDNCTALSMFGENVAQNLTNEKLGYTYSDGKNGIYMFFDTDKTAFSGSIFSNGTYALIGGGALAVIAVISYFISKSVKKKRNA